MGRPCKNIKVKPSLQTDVKAKCDLLDITLQTLSTDVLLMGANYASQSLSEGNINAEVYEKLCRWLKVDKEKYLLDEEEKPEEENGSLNADIIVNTTGIYNKLNELLTEQKRTNLLLQEMVRVYKEDSLGRKNMLTSVLGTGVTVEKMAEDMHMTKEKVTAIFTEVKYNMEG